MCIFCDIIQNQIPSYKIYEDNDLIAILDISQTTKGHTLIIPKQHYENLLECSDELIAKLFIKSKTISSHLMHKLGATGINILSNINESAGQTISHFHIHLIPRYNEKDSVTIEFSENKNINLSELEKLLQLVSKI